MYTYLLPPIRRTIIQDSNRSAAKWAAAINVVPKYYYSQKIKKKTNNLKHRL